MKAPPLMCARSATPSLLLLLLITGLLIILPARAAPRNSPARSCCSSVCVKQREFIRVAAASCCVELSFPRKFWNFEAGGGIAVETTIRPPAGVKDMVRERRLVWRELKHKEPPLSNSHARLGQTLVPERRIRGRRHARAGSRGHVHGRLLRVGCVLGTCQVQNLSYRLYQLIGQRKREHSSPVDLRSPLSFG